MNLDDAKEMIAKYLVGFPIDKELLSEACKVASEDDDYIRLFRDVPGLDETMGEEDYMGLCEVFADRIDELSELEWSELESDWPEMYTHLTLCRACLKLRFELNPFWYRLDEPPSEPTGEEQKVLPEPLIITFRPQGPVKQLAGFPRIKPVRKVASLGGPARPWRWELPDEEAGYTIILELRGGRKGFAFLSCKVEPSVGRDDRFRIETTKINESGERVPGLEDDLPQERIPLEFGSWSIQITAKIRGDGIMRRRWCIPLELKEQ